MRIRRLGAVLAIYAVGVISMAVPASAQGVAPDVTITCDSPDGGMDVSPGATYSVTVTCTANNPSSHQVTVRLQVNARDLAYAAPGVVTLNSAGSQSFDVTVMGQPRMEHGSRSVTVTGYVDQFNGVQNPTPSPRESTFLVQIEQFAYFRVEAVEPFTQLGPRDDYYFEFKLHNDGNARDKFYITIPNQATLEEADFQVVLPAVSIEVDPQQYEKVRVQIRTPKTQGWTDRYFQLTLDSTSDFEDRDTSGNAKPVSQTITIYVRGIYLPAPGAIASLGMMMLAVAFARPRNYEDDPILLDSDGQGLLVP